MTATTLRIPFQLHTESPTFSPAHIWTQFSLWYDRAHQRHHLSQLSSEQLKDIGATRDHAIAEAAKPFWQC
jgi:uncharacterized protein YjiS (DUF1127 family)